MMLCMMLTLHKQTQPSPLQHSSTQNIMKPAPSMNSHIVVEYMLDAFILPPYVGHLLFI